VITDGRQGGVTVLLSVQQAAERVGVSESLIYQWCEERRLAHYRLGGKGKRGKIGISPSDLDSFMASLRVEGEASPRWKYLHLNSGTG
jgi:excisionase family DNA binding protein